MRPRSTGASPPTPRRDKVLIQHAVKDFDDRRLRAAKAYDDALATVKTLSGEVSRLLKQSNRKSSSTTADKLSANETRLAPAQAALDEIKRELDTLDASRPRRSRRPPKSRRTIFEE